MSEPVTIEATLTPGHAKLLRQLVEVMGEHPAAAVVTVFVVSTGEHTCSTKLVAMGTEADVLAAGEQALESAAKRIGACDCPKCKADSDTILQAVASLQGMRVGEAVH